MAHPLHTDRGFRPVLAFALGMGSSLTAGVADAEPRWPPSMIVPTVRMDDAVQAGRVVSLIDVYRTVSLMAPDTIPDVVSRIETTNFFFASGAGFIVDQRVSESAIDVLSDAIVDRMSSLPTNSSHCYIQDFKFGDGRNLTVVVHDETGGTSDDVFRCLVAGLRQYSRGDISGYDPINWRRSYVDLLTAGEAN